MLFIRQIRLEVRNILKSRFLLIIAILTILAALAVPVLGYTSQQAQNRDAATRPTTGVMYAAAGAYEKEAAIATMRSGIDYVNKGEPVVIDGVTIEMTNPLYWNLFQLTQEKATLGKGTNPFSSPAALDLMLKLTDAEIQYYLVFARTITTSPDYRIDVVQMGVQSVYDRFFLENADKGLTMLQEVAGYRKLVDPSTIKAKYLDLTSEKRLAAIDKAAAQIQQLQDIVTRNDFPGYIGLRISLARDQIKSLEENIAIQEQAIVQNPSQEQNLNQVIEDLRSQIRLIETSTIPVLEYRLAKNIIPGLDIWQNRALSDIENARSQLNYLKIQTEEEWRNGQGNTLKMSGYRPDGSQPQTYAQYVANMQIQIAAQNRIIAVAQRSLDTGRPDMKYVPDGSRSRTVGYLNYSALVMLFGVMLGGWLIASEYQQGTIRLLMIRPRTRSKILLAKFTAALTVWVAVNLVSCLLNLIANGALFGFTDFTYPNYSIGGATSFLAYYFPRMLACMLPILFSFTAAFALSVIVKNMAVAIALPIVFYIASFIFLNMAGYGNRLGWIVYTPIPYMQLSLFYANNGESVLDYLVMRGLNLTFGMLLLFGLSVFFVGISVLTFKKRDIVN